ncbi:protein kinase [bacterium]|nr:protein kinase [bacterium]
MKPADSTNPVSGIRFEEPLPPPSVPDHELIRCVGRGSYGEVWLARNVMGTYRAVKVVHRASFRDDHPFEREYAGLKRFEPVSRSHDSQVDILHMGRSEDSFYYVMELADDEITGPEIDPDNYRPKTLRGSHEGHIQYTADETLEIGLALTTALEHLHKHGLVHRDIKPSNVIFVNGIPKLADIGLVSSVDATRSFVGTEGFVPPEGPGAPTGDLYSLGKVLYELCTGRDRKDYPELPTAIAELPDRERLLELNAIIAKACRESPKDRYQTATAMKQDLLLMQSGKSVRRMQKLEQRLVQVRQLGIAATVIILLATSAYLFQRQQTAEAKRLADENIKLADESQRNANASQKNAKESNDNLVRLLVANGNRLVESGDFANSLPWFAEALKRVQGDKEREEMHRIRIDSVVKQFPRPVQIIKHAAGVGWCEFSPDGHRLATASNDHTARVWDVATGQPVTPPLKHDDVVRSIVFSPDGSRVATASRDKTVRVWDASTGESVLAPLVHDEPVVGATYSRDGSWLLTTSIGGPARLWDATTGKRLGLDMGSNVLSACFSPDGSRILTGMKDGTATISKATNGVQEVSVFAGSYVNAAAFSPDGRSFVTGSGIPSADLTYTQLRPAGFARVWKSTDGTPVTGELPHHSAVTRTCFNRDGNRIITSEVFFPDGDSTHIWDARTGKQVGGNRAAAMGFGNNALSPEGSRLATCSDFAGNPPRVWDAETLSPVCPPLPQAGWGLHVAFSPDGRLLATASEDSIVRIWDLANDGGSNQVLRGQVGEKEQDEYLLKDARFSPDGRNILVGYLGAAHNGSARLWDSATGKQILPKMRYSSGCVGLIEFAPDGKKFLLAPPYRIYGTNVSVWDAATGKMCFELNHSDAIWFATFSPDGRHLATASHDKTARVWDATTGRAVGPELRHDSLVWHTCFAPDSRRLLTIDWTDDNRGSVHVWDWSAGRELVPALRQERGPILFAIFSPDGNRIITVGADQRIYIWNAATGKLIIPPIFNGGNMRGVCFHPNGRTFATWGAAEWASVWDIDTGTRLLPKLAHQEAITSVEFSRDGRLIVTASEDKTARVWDGTTGEAVSVPLRHAGVVMRASFHPNGHQILTASADGAARTWGVDSIDWPIGDVLALLTVLCPFEIDKTLTPTSANGDQIAAAFDLLRKRHPEFVALKTEGRLPWHRRMADESELAGHWAYAQWHLTALLKDDPDNTKLLEQRADAEANLGWWKEAHRDLVREAELGSWNLRCLMYSALKAGDFATAREVVRRLIQKTNGDKEARWAAALRSTLVPGLVDDYSTTIGIAEELAHESPNDVQCLQNLAMQYYRAARLKDAEQILESPVIKPLLGPKQIRSVQGPLLFTAAIILSASGDAKKARELVSLGTHWENTVLNGNEPLGWEARVYWELLRTEAESMIKEHEHVEAASTDAK